MPSSSSVASESPLQAPLRAWLARLFIVGPDPVVNPDDASKWDTLLTWPARLLIVAGAAAVGWVWTDAPVGVQLGWALQYGLLAAVSIVTSFWIWTLIANTGIAALWLACSWSAPQRPLVIPASGEPDPSPSATLTLWAKVPERGRDGGGGGPARGAGWSFSDSVTWVNRQIGHMEALAAWAAVALVLWPRLCLQLPALAAVLVLGEPLLNGLARTRFFGGTEARERRAALMMARRSLIYIATLVGLLLLLSQAPRQWQAILPLFLTVIPGLALRIWRFMRRKNQEQGRRDVHEARLRLAERQQRVAPAADLVGPALVLGLFAALVVASLWTRHSLAASARGDADGPPPPTDACVPDKGGPVTPALAVFVIADTQLHELGGDRFPGQMEVADALVPVTRRPVELDMLSAAAVVRGQSLFAQLTAERHRRNLSAPLWAHLGDLADLSCVGEMERMEQLLASYGGGQRLLAGIAPGNHDSAFQGNFGWSPYWDGACQARLDKTTSDERIQRLMAARLVPEGATFGLVGWSPASLPGQRPVSRFTVTKLGAVPDRTIAAPRDNARGVVAIFFDTSDRLARDFGIAGTYGTFSARQRREILDEVRRVKEQGGAFADPWFILFGHHPYMAMTSSGRSQVDELVEALDAPGADGSGPRVIALVTAHTHDAEAHRHCVQERFLREIVVGSMLDPPQQAALLEIGTDAHGRGAARLVTWPLVGRPGRDCISNAGAGGAGQPIGGGEGGMSSAGPAPVRAGACRRAMAELAGEPACQELLAVADAGDGDGESCETLEAPLSSQEQLEGIVRHGGPQDPDDVARLQEKRARTLLKCVARKSTLSPGVWEHPLAGEAYAPVIESLARDPGRADELTCLAWAASAVQAHKARGMTIADAIRCGFDDPTIPAAQSTVATLEDVPCH